MAKSIGHYLKIFVPLGIIAGVLVYVLNMFGLEVPLVIGNKTYYGSEAAIRELIAVPVGFIILGFIVGILVYAFRSKQTS
ncbi:hypothetical protein PO903_16000 [Paenibacillus sp. PK4536]|uniref:Uncharacterized protein n=1 Tax=Paenibacillus nuruki TaxID=1886670 RepID=A0A1E3L4A0_9BACL|nr:MULTISPECIES: hypothetical protein [Paenibacillus]ODP28473.1 hypothetical protein PTI45_02223 [Paenibacillus nuruki]TKJ89491.1 hypothetical protein PaeCFBP13512_15325 [Paenibacillus sp. CFBP13512]WIM38146.1 hypothetical protein PO903_16000 [Paenibacillus sp. PK4536]